MLNKVTLIGNVGQDPDIRSTKDGKEIANLTLATSESWKDKATGERKTKTEWHRISIFSQGLVGIIKNYVKKGSKLYIEGQLQTRKWTDKSGVEKYTTEIILQNYNSNLQILNFTNSQDSSGYQNSDQSIEATIKNEFQGAKEVELDDDIPF